MSALHFDYTMSARSFATGSHHAVIIVVTIQTEWIFGPKRPATRAKRTNIRLYLYFYPARCYNEKRNQAAPRAVWRLLYDHQRQPPDRYSGILFPVVS